ncbi:translation initiation factor IF-2 isoform X1 [Epinephelus moara]|uniref:translation initiation factor IF-2 isoform X1 n=1 Tax=Epinephelus moara TaxID=300413 RepID=UPI00214E4265|nr:translation initiation factor IF-2 isoform X1 [Epinephelus moara]
MPSLGLSFFILGFAVASVTANTTVRAITTASDKLGADITYATTVTTLSNNNTTTTDNSPIINTTQMDVTTSSGTNVTKGNSTISPLTTKQKDSGNESPGNTSYTPVPSVTTPTPKKSTTKTATKPKPKEKTPTAEPKTAAGSDSTGIIILVVIIIVALAFGVACYFARKRGRRYSVDFTSRPDEANIPLSTIEPELPIDSAPQNGLTTFESAETTTQEPQEPEAKPEAQEEQKAEADKPAVEPSAESAPPAPSPDSSEDKPKEDVVEQPPPAAPVEQNVEEKTDDEGTVSNKTSVESLKETNENNSNNVCQLRDLERSSTFWDVPLNCPV